MVHSTMPVKGKRYSYRETFIIGETQHDIIRYNNVVLGIIITDLKTGFQFVQLPTFP